MRYSDLNSNVRGWIEALIIFAAGIVVGLYWRP